jgi:hypothetical protein
MPSSIALAEVITVNSAMLIRIYRQSECLLPALLSAVDRTCAHPEVVAFDHVAQDAF